MLSFCHFKTHTKYTTQFSAFERRILNSTCILVYGLRFYLMLKGHLRKVNTYLFANKAK